MADSTSLFDPLQGGAIQAAASEMGVSRLRLAVTFNPIVSAVQGHGVVGTRNLKFRLASHSRLQEPLRSLYDGIEARMPTRKLIGLDVFMDSTSSDPFDVVALLAGGGRRPVRVHGTRHRAAVPVPARAHSDAVHR
jgi:hypothetical protein